MDWTDCYIMLSMGYATSSFPDFESYLKVLADLDEDDTQLKVKQ